MFCHVWFVTKYRKPCLVGKVDARIKSIFKECINRHQYRVLEFETSIDHAHFLIEVEDEEDLSATIRTIKAVSAKEINKEYPQKSGKEKSFWARRFGYRELGIPELRSVGEYVRNQKKVHGN